MTVETEEETVTLECAAGHSFTIPRPRKGKWPSYCSEHRRFFYEQLSGRVKPPRRVILEWNEQGEMLDDDEYTKRWTKFWIETVRMVGAKHRSWNGVDVALVEKYVRAMRMSELHRLYAQDKPYSETSRGTVNPHPGFKLSVQEENRANEIAVEMGLSVNGSAPAEKSGGRPAGADYFNTRLQEEAESLGELSQAAGPDGASL